MHDKGSLILRWFEQHPEEYVSGEKLSNLLQCSRTAIWKHINRLKERGYEFEAVPRRGYRLTFSPDRIDPQRLQKLLETKQFGRRFHLYPSVYTTMQTAREHRAEGEGTVVLAEVQTRGKGRLGRDWHSPAGKGLWFSMVLSPLIPLQQMPQLTLLTSVSLCRAIRRVCGVDVKIKWPNDLLLDGKKVCGILMESTGEDERLQFCIAGVGINVNMDLHDFPTQLQPLATSLKLFTGERVDRTELLATFLNEWEQQYELYLEHGFAPIRTLWEALTDMLGTDVRLVTPSGDVLSGKAIRLEDSGALLIEQADGTRKKVYSAEIPLTK